MTNYLSKIQKDGYIILDLSKDFNLSSNKLQEFDNIVNYYKENHLTLFKEIFFHTEKQKINNFSEFEKLVETHLKNYDTNRWFQLWRFTALDTDYGHHFFMDDILKKIVETVYNKVATEFLTSVTSFTKNCGIKPHKDATNNNRQCGILMYCNDTWEQEWGGNLVINNKDTILPIKNTVVVFDYTKNNINHEVTKVESDKNRFCITTFVNKL